MIEGLDRTPLTRDFFDRPVLDVAPDLLGRTLVRDTADGPIELRLTEVEAYAGEIDPGSHAFRGRTRRNSVMYGPPATRTSTSPTAWQGGQHERCLPRSPC